MKSLKQIHSLVCCSMTFDSKSLTHHLVAPAVSTEYPTIQADAHRRLNQEEQRALDLANEEEREKPPKPRCLACMWNLVIPILEE